MFIIMYCMSARALVEFLLSLLRLAATPSAAIAVRVAIRTILFFFGRFVLFERCLPQGGGNLKSVHVVAVAAVRTRNRKNNRKADFFHLSVILKAGVIQTYHTVLYKLVINILKC